MQNNISDFMLKPIEDKDISLIEQWLSKAYIRKWYHEPEEWIREIRERDGEFSFLKHFLVMDEGRPFAFCQYYDCFDAQEEWYTIDSPGRVYSIDYLIGEEEYLGKGFGKAIVKVLVDKIKSNPGAEEIVVQPEEENLPSCKSLLANGFIFDKEKEYYYLLL